MTDPFISRLLMETKVVPASAERSTQIRPTVSRPDFEPYPPGSTLDRRYVIEEVRGGRGVSGMGIVYIVTDGKDRYAAKTFQRAYAHDVNFIQRFVREARIWMQIPPHPHIVQAYWLDIINAVPYLFIEYVRPSAQGQFSLADWLKQGPLPLDKCLAFAVQLCRGLAHAGRAVPGIVHRDLKPENLLIAADETLKVTDFGLVRVQSAAVDLEDEPATTPGDEDNLTQVGSIFGTPAYMAPEQFRKADEVTPTADVYGFGCCVYEMICGSPPFTAQGETTVDRVLKLKEKHLHAAPTRLRERASHCPEALERIVMRCLEKAPADRFSSFEEVLASLEPCCVTASRSCVRVIFQPPPLPSELAEQARSVSLLSGYERAIQHRHLRENQYSSPYDFHLALASFFHCQGDLAEERRQLEKAVRCVGQETGYEAVRRLALLLVKQGAVHEAQECLTRFLQQSPDRADQMLEPFVQIQCALGLVDVALARLRSASEAMNVDRVLLEALAVSGRTDEYVSHLKHVLEQMLEGIAAQISALRPDAVVGWDYPDDKELLIEVLAVLRPECDCDVLRVTDDVFWPDLSGDPDFSSEMAWLSQLLGELVRCDPSLGPREHAGYTRCADLLDYPHRFPRQRERDEYWLWLRDMA